MKIGLVCPYNIYRSGGVQQHVLAQASELRKRGHTVKIITPRPRGYLADPKLDVIFIGNSTPVKTPIKTTLELGISLGRDAVDIMLEKENFDVLHIHEPEVPVLGAQIVAKASCPIVATFHAIHPETPMARTIETFRIPYSKSIFSKLSAITAVSEAAAEFVKKRSGQTVHIIPNGVDLNKFQPTTKKLAKKKKTILYIGRLEKRKGVKYLLSAYEKIAKESDNVQLIIAGEGGLRSGLEAFVAENKIKNVVFRGYVDDREKINLLQNADVFCSPAIYGESFGIVLLEAMACGVPIVAGDNPGYSSVLKNTGSISLVSPKDTSDFARRIQVFLFDESLRKIWLEWAKPEVANYTYAKITDQYEKIYAEI